MNTTSIIEQSDARGPAPVIDDATLRARVHGGWAAVAAAWGERADYVDTRVAGVTARLLELAAIRQGERVLELACGPGGAGLAAAEQVGPEGEVVVSDVVAEMTSIAVARAEALGLANVRARVLDLEEIAEPDASFDVVLCREGLMFAADPARALREIKRVLRPGGRVAISVWGPRESNPWLGLVMDAVSAHAGKPVPPHGVPGPFSLGDSDRLAALLHDAGLSEVAVGELPTPLVASSFDQWWATTLALAGPLSTILAGMPEPASQALRGRLRGAIRGYETPTGLELPGLALVASARV
jgi:SAM-dependent methyltransferase